MEMFKEFTFEAAHFLPNVPDDHKCKRLHGHSYNVTIYVEGDMAENEGWVIDFGQLKEYFKPIHDQLDHRFLNDIKGLENPTSENLAHWIWHKLKPDLHILSKIKVKETCSSGCIYTGN